MPKLELIIPSEKYLASYLDALTRGWSPDNIRGAEAAAEEIVEIAQDPARFIAQRADDREAKGGPVKMPDGSTVERLPGFNRWLPDSEFCGSIGFRWQPGRAELPPHVSWAYRLLGCTVEKGTKIRWQSAWTHVERDASRGTPLCPIGDRFRQYCVREGDPFKRRQANRRIPQACANTVPVLAVCVITLCFLTNPMRCVFTKHQIEHQARRLCRRGILTKPTATG
jgi:hypothetical protein